MRQELEGLNTSTYLYRIIEAKESTILPAQFGSDDALIVWLNGKKIVSNDVHRAVRLGDDKAALPLKAGENELLIRVHNYQSESGYCFWADLPSAKPLEGTTEPSRPGREPGATEPLVAGPPPTPKKRLPVPSATAQEPVSEQLDETYDLSKLRRSSEKLDTAKELFKVAGQPDTRPVEKFVLLRRAAELATGGGDARFMLEVVDAIGADFEVDSLSVKDKVLRKFATGATDTESIKSFVEASRGVVDEALAEKRYETALELAEGTYRLCMRSAGKEFRKAAYERRNEVRKTYRRWQEFRQTLAKLKANPNDADAHLLVGRWRCFDRGNWGQGLPYLANGSDATLAAVARQDLTSPSKPSAQIQLADAWWDASEGREDKEQETLQLRAGVWYQKAQPRLPAGLSRVKVERRLAEIAKLGRPIAEPASQPRPATRARRFAPTTAKLLRTLQGHTHQVWQVSFSPRGTILASSAHDAEVRLWDAATGRLRATLKGHRLEVRDVVFSPDGTTVVTASRDGTLRFWGVATGQLRRTLEHTGPRWGVALSPDGAALASTVEEGVGLWDVATGRIRQTLEHPKGVRCMLFSPNGSILATGCEDSNIRLWNVRTGQLRRTLTECVHTVAGLAFSHNGLVLTSGGYDNKVRIWDVGTGQVRFTLEGHTRYVYDVAFTPDGLTLASASVDKSVRFWDPATGGLQHTLQTGTEGLHRLAFSSDGSMLATAGLRKDELIQIWGFSEAATAAPASKRRSTRTGTPRLPKELPSGRRPPPAVAPFDAKQAKRHQQAWAKYLGLPVERQIDLPGGETLTMVLIPPGSVLGR